MSATRDYHAAWDFGRLGLGPVSGANGAVFSGAVSGSAGADSGVYTHGYRTYTDGSVTVASINDLVTYLVTGLTMTFDFPTMRYTIAAGGVFGVAWSGLLGLAMAEILGFSASAPLAGAATYTSTQRPKYLIRAVMPGQSEVEETYRPSGRASYKESASGRPYSILPYSRPTYSEWVQPMEKRLGPTDAEWLASPGVAGAPVRIADAFGVFKVTWSWEHFFNHCSSVLPFALLDDAGEIAPTDRIRVWRMTGDREAFHPARPSRDWSGVENIPFSCIYIGLQAEV